MAGYASTPAEVRGSAGYGGSRPDLAALAVPQSRGTPAQQVVVAAMSLLAATSRTVPVALAVGVVALVPYIAYGLAALVTLIRDVVACPVCGLLPFMDLPELGPSPTQS